MKQKCLPVEDLCRVREELRAQNRTVVQCHGCFDIVHPGHIRYLRFAREQGDVLIVSVSGDDVVAKGADRPYINEDLRVENLAALEFVDYVCIDHNTWAGPILEVLRPDVYIKGKEYESKQDARFAREKALVESYGGKVIFSSGDVVYSSTAILERFRHRFPLEQEKVRFYCRRHGITRQVVEELFPRFLKCRILVLGDPILDRYVYSEAVGIAAESPILSVSPFKEDEFIGAGGLIVGQLAALGAQAGFLTVLGGDDDGKRLARTLEDLGVRVTAVVAEQRPTFIKTRYLVEEDKVFKVDSGRYAPLSTGQTQQVISQLERQLPDYDALVVTDFGYGLFGQELVDAVPALCERLGKPYFVDVSRLGRVNILKFKRPRLATPTEPELRFALADSESGLSNLASRYYDETGAEKLVLTMAKRGVVFFHPPAELGARLEADYLPALTAHPIDPVGAGDVFLAGVVLAEMAGAPATSGIYLGSALSALHINRLGNDPVGLDDLQAYLAGREELRS